MQKISRTEAGNVNEFDFADVVEGQGALLAGSLEGEIGIGRHSRRFLEALEETLQTQEEQRLGKDAVVIALQPLPLLRRVIPVAQQPSKIFGFDVKERALR